MFCEPVSKVADKGEWMSRIFSTGVGRSVAEQISHASERGRTRNEASTPPNYGYPIGMVPHVLQSTHRGFVSLRKKVCRWVNSI